MTPYELRILLDVFVGTPPSVDTSAPIYNETIEDLAGFGWVRTTGGSLFSTGKLNFFMEHILSLPHPVQVWQMAQQEGA